MSKIELTEDQLNKLMKTAIESAMKEKEKEKPNNKIMIPKFSGKENEKFEDYLFQVEIWIEATDGSDKNKSAMIISGLSGNALDTIKKMPKETILNDHGHEIIIEELKKRYGQDQSVEEYKRITEFNNIKQLEEEDYREFISRFDRMKKDCERIKDVNMNKKCNAYMMIERSKMNDIERKMILTRITEVEDPYEEAKKAINNIMSSAVTKKERKGEPQWMSRDKAANHTERKYCDICQYSNHNTQDCWYTKEKNNTHKNQAREYCRICQRDNHQAKDCWWNDENKDRCFKCKKKGHIAKHCQEAGRGSDTSYIQNNIPDSQLLREDLLAILDTGSNVSVVGEL
jgi:hypothetical protein